MAEHIQREIRDAQLQQNKGVSFVTFPRMMQYDDRVIHGFSTRLGGVSEGEFASMNLSFDRGDDAERVMENRRRFASALGYDESRLVFSHQVHGTCIRAVSEEDCGGGITKMRMDADADGLATDVPNVPIMTFFADCVPLFFYDPVRGVVAMAHSGWRGTVQKIGARMISFLEQHYGSHASDLICAVGPSVCRNCYEVDRNVAERFVEQFSKLHAEEIVFPYANDKFHIDLQSACRNTLLAGGVLPEHLDVTNLCTCCHPELLFSHRASKGKRGSLAGVMMLRTR